MNSIIHSPIISDLSDQLAQIGPFGTMTTYIDGYVNGNTEKYASHPAFKLLDCGPRHAPAGTVLSVVLDVDWSVFLIGPMEWSADGLVPLNRAFRLIFGDQSVPAAVQRVSPIPGQLVETLRLDVVVPQKSIANRVPLSTKISMEQRQVVFPLGDFEYPRTGESHVFCTWWRLIQQRGTSIHALRQEHTSEALTATMIPALRRSINA